MRIRAVAAFLFLAACGVSAGFRTEAAADGLAGPVHTVLTQTIVYDEDQSAQASAPNSLVTYNPEGFSIEEIGRAHV